MVLMLLCDGPCFRQGGMPLLRDGIEVGDVGFAKVLRRPICFTFYVNVEEVVEVCGREGLVREESERMTGSGPFFSGFPVLEADDGAVVGIDGEDEVPGFDFSVGGEGLKVGGIGCFGDQ